MTAAKSRVRASLVVGVVIALGVQGSLAGLATESASPAPEVQSPLGTPGPEPAEVFISQGTSIPDPEVWAEQRAPFYERAEFGGTFLYTDSERRYMPVVMWTGDIEALALELTELLGEDAAFEIRAVERSMTELEEVVEGVRALYPEFYERDMLVVSISINPKTNRVDVGIQGPMDVARELLAPFGDAVRVFGEDIPQLD